MTKPEVAFADPERLVIDYLRGRFTGRTEPYLPATITTDFPASALSGATHLQVELELGGADDYPVTERAQVRLTAYSAPGRRSDAKNLAGLAQALLYAHPGDANVAGAKILLGRSDVTKDPDTGNLMCWFLGRVDLKATPLAS